MARTTEGLVVGQEVVIKTMAEIRADDDKNSTKNLENNPCYFNPMMEGYSGRKAVIEGFEDTGKYMLVKLSPRMGDWCWAPYMLKPLVSKYPSNYGKVKHAHPKV